jgi:hypothetical protein
MNITKSSQIENSTKGKEEIIKVIGSGLSQSNNNSKKEGYKINQNGNSNGNVLNDACNSYSSIRSSNDLIKFLNKKRKEYNIVCTEKTTKDTSLEKRRNLESNYSSIVPNGKNYNKSQANCNATTSLSLKESNNIRLVKNE